jgi:beta-lactamase regulating signal transducer with metallopeptidase domain
MTWWEQMSDAIRALAAMSMCGGAATLVLFALKPIVRHKTPKAAQYHLWLVALAAFLVPVSVFVSVPAGSGLPNIHAALENALISGYEYQEREMWERTGHTSQLSEEEIRQMSEDDIKRTVNIFAETGRTKTLLNLAAFQIPMTGFLTFLSCFLSQYLKFARRLKRRNAPARSEEFAVLAGLCGNGRVPKLYRNPLAPTPMLIGVFRPEIVLPDVEYTDARLKNVLLHELTHLRRKDVLIKWLSVFACSLHWFNPLVWLVRREIDRVCELACDEAVIMRLGPEDRQKYGDTLIAVAAENKTPKVVLSTTMCEEKKSLKERLVAIMQHKKAGRFAVASSVLLIAAVAAGTAILGAGSGSKDDTPEAIADLVKNFGLQFQKVQLVAPAETVIREILEYYSDSVTADLLKKWTDNPEIAPGRVGSSPWPDRIEIVDTEKLYETEYAVSGEVIWITSTERMNGGSAWIQPINLSVVKIGADWKISEVSRGESDSSAAGELPSDPALNIPMIAIYEQIPGGDYLATFPPRNSVNHDDYTRLTPDAETGWILLNDTVTVAATLPVGIASFNFYYAPAGTEQEGVSFAKGGFDKLTEQTTVLGDFAAAEWFPEGFHGHIWVVAEDADGTERCSEIVNANYVPLNRSDIFAPSELQAAMTAVNEKFKDFKGCTMTGLWYDEKKSVPYMAAYIADAERNRDGIAAGNAIMLYSNFDVDSSGGDGSLNPNGSYTNWMWLLVRDGPDGGWRVVDWGY